ncbi:hypothetical protein JTE90_016973 [Oedothorax gibbosus]|uniref:Uncharacterized protein n=1 Tax=Oedothorax gibbosus TaxID=931172 RepID=A0AAV6UHX4_9ARAC|nr:hypothetical protein JTE90_016973 [Oedothorax gibbosus]
MHRFIEQQYQKKLFHINQNSMKLEKKASPIIPPDPIRRFFMYFSPVAVLPLNSGSQETVAGTTKDTRNPRSS